LRLAKPARLHAQILSLILPDKEDVVLPTDGMGLVRIGDHGELSELKRMDVADAFRSSRRRVLFLDYGGTLVDVEGAFSVRCVC
jgi:hypothetical protein